MTSSVGSIEFGLGTRQTTPVSFWIPLVVAVLLVAGLAISRYLQRKSLLARLRAEWGQPQERRQNPEVVALYHRGVAHDDGRSVDQRTWNDLDLDAVFAALDRTHSPLGQQVLYHRLRTAPQSAHLPAFEALVTRMSDDPEARERAQVALTRVQGPATSDLWWLTQPGVLDSRPWWYIAFPILTPVVPVALVLVPFIPGAVGVALLGVLVNLGLRYNTAPRLRPLIQPLRQVGPLLAVAETLSPFMRGDAAPLGESLSTDLSRLARLRRMAGWVSRDPTGANDLIVSIFEYLNLLFNLDCNVLYFAAPEIQARGEALLRTIKAVGEVDAALSIASYRAGTAGWTRPRFLPATHQTTLENMRHPLLVEAVPNSITCQGRSKIRPPWRRKTRPSGRGVAWLKAAVRRRGQDAGAAAGGRAFLLCSRR